jgi:Arc/MetJ-type ribon-helix-helix transcriptional regulator
VNHLPNIILAVRIPETLKQQIEQFIKEKYPEYKTYSDVIREALKRFLAECEKA